VLPKEGVDEVGDGLGAHGEVLELASARAREAKRAPKSAREGKERERTRGAERGEKVKTSRAKVDDKDKKRERNEGDGCRGRAKVKGGKSDVKTKKNLQKKSRKNLRDQNRFL
jgi:hypothetical protein